MVVIFLVAYSGYIKHVSMMVIRKKGLTDNVLKPKVLYRLQIVWTPTNFKEINGIMWSIACNCPFTCY